MSLNRAAGVISRAVQTLSRWDDARRTRDALGRLSAHELRDIGFDAGDLAMDALTRR